MNIKLPAVLSMCFLFFVCASPGRAASAWDDFNIEVLPAVDGVTTEAEIMDRWPNEGWRSAAISEKRLRLYRAEGIKRWKVTPDDPKFFRWFLKAAVESHVFYWRDAEAGARLLMEGISDSPGTVDLEAQRRWSEYYFAMRAQFIQLCRSQNDKKSEQKLRHKELYYPLVTDIRSKVQRGELELLPHVMLRVQDYLANPEWQMSGFMATAIALNALLLLKQSPELESTFVSTLVNSPVPELKTFGEGRARLHQLREAPMLLKVDGLIFGARDLDKMRDKVVLVDVWSNYCSVCIKAMPKLQRVYEKYRSRGFEIVGVWLEPEGADVGAEARKVALSHLERQGVTYFNGVLKSPDVHHFMEKYGFTGVPQTLLLARGGTLAATSLTDVELEARLQKLLSH